MTAAVHYVVITPVRDEEARIEQTIRSMLAQTVRPIEWVIVDDGSTDRTGEILDRHAAQHPWIRVVHRKDRGRRVAGGGVVDAFYDGYHALAATAWDFIVKLDGDLEFDPGYFARCFARFGADPKLGVGGGRVATRLGSELHDDGAADPQFHVRGATKIYRRACWLDIGELIRAPGWDTLDEVKANMCGWTTTRFNDLTVVQLKATGAMDGVWRNWFKNGRANYIAGYHPLFMALKCARRLFQRPWLVAAVALYCGYVSGFLVRAPRLQDERLMGYLRDQQVRRILGRKSLWTS